MDYRDELGSPRHPKAMPVILTTPAEVVRETGGGPDREASTVGGSTHTLVLLFPVSFLNILDPPHFELLSALALSALHHMVAGSLSSVDVKNLPGHKLRAIQIEHRVYNVGHISHPTHWMERRQRLMCFRRVHRRLDYPR